MFLRSAILALSITLSASASIIYSSDGTATPGFTNTAGFGGPFAPNVAMRFVASTSGVLSTITVPLSMVAPNSSVVFQLLADMGGAPGVVLDSFTFTVPGSPTLLTANSTSHPLLTAGAAYWIESGWTMQQRVLWFDANPVASGTVWSSTGGVETDQALAAFALQSATQVPEPSEGVLFAAGLLFFVCASKTRTLAARHVRVQT